ncbi:MAG: helix-turn-helix domain-containing protein [Desulfovibrionales bacterium]|nr:helix-turn-helix domain-containing protein [Desulfovibrionales bacterium]
MQIKQLRKSRGLSQIELAERVGISFQQIQKYEKGVANITVSRLQQLSEALGIHITSFFEEGNFVPKVSGPVLEYTPGEIPLEHFQLLDKEEIIILKFFRKIRNKKLREGLLKHMRGIIELEKKK